ncbi:MAG: hypothetical protein K2O10_00110, partial [Muribaculaceae bacterium]|nr:hypothetical protein [Muribaculaceae bacterium]
GNCSNCLSARLGQFHFAMVSVFLCYLIQVLIFGGAARGWRDECRRAPVMVGRPLPGWLFDSEHV